MTEHQTVVDGHPVLKNTGIEFDSRLSAITGMQVPGRRSTVPVTGNKNERIQEVVRRIEVEANALLIYAMDQNNPNLESDIPNTYSGLVEGSEVSQVERFWKVHDRAKLAGAALVPYGVSAALVAELDTMLPELENLIGSPRSGIDKRILKRSQLETAFNEMDDFLNRRLDRVVRTCSLSDPAFVEAYFLARKLHDTATRPATSPQTTAPAANVPANGRTTALPTTEELASAMSEAVTNNAGTLNGVH